MGTPTSSKFKLRHDAQKYVENVCGTRALEKFTQGLKGETQSLRLAKQKNVQVFLLNTNKNTEIFKAYTFLISYNVILLSTFAVEKIICVWLSAST